MSRDQISKSPRQVQCRDYLWELFQKMSAELECSVDYLINEAMRVYAKSYQEGHPGQVSAETTASSTNVARGAAPLPPSNTASGIPSLGAMRSSISNATGPVPLPPPPPSRPSMSAFPAVSAPARSYVPGPASSAAPFPPPERSSGGFGQSGPPSHTTGPFAPVFPAGPSSIPTQGVRPQLYAVYGGQKVPVHSDEFIIGRGSKSSDLTIKDGNISRRHAAVVFENGAYYLKDLGSTNGVEYQGRRIGGKRIDEGDVFLLCDHEVRFTYL
ncbi:MAG: FHA domain-containing protein [Myxococcales bacterium]|nr:MAG: FHA domain-containing protein [Myxococcales bacterium]